MIIKMQADQVAAVWDTVKYSMIKANNIPEHLQQDYSNNMLYNFLSGNYQCWLDFTLDEKGEKTINAIATTKIVKSADYGINILSVNTVYSFVPLTDQMAIEAFEGFKKFAIENNCQMLSTETKIDRMKEIAHLTGFEEHNTIYRMFL